LAALVGVAPTATAIAVERGLDGLATAAIERGGDPARVLTHVDHDLAVDGAADLDPDHLAELTRMEVAGELTPTQAKQILTDMLATGRDPRTVAAERGFEAMDEGDLVATVDAILAENPGEWADYVADEKRRGKLTGFFVGKVMKATQGQADGKAVTELLRRRAEGPS
jgi:aspartyl-tRNA(Asn)/glutamyl-tRNA(Gln) amidotransferase subunit B